MFVPTQSQQTKLLSACLSLLTTLNKGIDDILGRGAKGIIFSTGIEEGRHLGKSIPKTDSIEIAIQAVNEAFTDVWNIELFKEQDQADYMYEDELGQPSVKVVIHECPIRQAVLSHGMEQAGPICYLTNGNLCGMLSEITGKKVGMEIQHAGPNSCLKKIYFRK